MPYSSSLIDSEWEVLEPLLVEILPQKKQTRPSNWTKREIIDGIFYQLKNGCNWGLCCKNFLRTNNPHQEDWIMQPLQKFETGILFVLECHLWQHLESALF